MIESLKILRADKDDLPEIFAIQKLAFQENSIRYNDVNIPPLTQTLDELIEEATTYVFLKAVVQEAGQDKIVGSARGILRGDHAYIGRLIVHPDYQNQGIGRKLMLAMEQEFDTTKFELVVGHLDEKNIMLYSKLGYAVYAKEKVSENLSFYHMNK